MLFSGSALENQHELSAKWVRHFESKWHLSLFTAARHILWSFFFAIHRVVNVVIAPNAMIGECRNCFESVPGANVQWWSQGMDGWSGWGIMVVVECVRLQGQEGG